MKEIVCGVAGIVTKPYQRSREEGTKGFFIGLGSGVMGAITAPVTASLRLGTAVSQGVAASANSFGRMGRGLLDPNSVYSRFRPPRYINALNVVTEFNEELAIVHQILKFKYHGKYSHDSIKFFSYIPLTKKEGKISNLDPQSSILIITETMLLYFRLLTKEKKRGEPHRLFKVQLRKIQRCELFRNAVVARGTKQVFNLTINCYSQI